MCQLRDFWFQSRDSARSEAAQYQPAQAGVARRLKLQQRMILDRPECGLMRWFFWCETGRRLASKAAIPQDCPNHVVVHGAGQAVFFPPEQRPRLRARFFVKRIGILDKIIIGRGLGQGFHSASPNCMRPTITSHVRAFQIAAAWPRNRGRARPRARQMSHTARLRPAPGGCRRPRQPPPVAKGASP